VFVEGIASRLRQHMRASDLCTIDSRQADALGQLVATRPALVIAEGDDSRLEQVCPLNSLLAALPKVTVIRLDAKENRMQVVTSVHRRTGGTGGLIRTIQAALGPRPRTPGSGA
jgi:hypothetical protein